MSNLIVPTRQNGITSIKLEKVHKALEKYFGVSREEYLSNKKSANVTIRNIGMYVAMTISKIQRNLVMTSFGKDRTMYYHVIEAVDSWLERENMYKEELELLKGFLNFYLTEAASDIENSIFDVTKLEIVDTEGKKWVSNRFKSINLSLEDSNKTLKISLS